MKRILLVDRNLKTVEQLRDPLEQLSFDVEIALSGEIGLEILDQRRVDAVLLSLDDSAEDDSVGFVRELRGRFPDVPVVLVSEATDTSALTRLLGDSLQASHVKPLSLDALLVDIERVCR